jgi:hypothetical protein
MSALRIGAAGLALRVGAAGLALRICAVGLALRIGAAGFTLIPVGPIVGRISFAPIGVDLQFCGLVTAPLRTRWKGYEGGWAG